MILKASQRGGGKQLALHLLRTDENEQVEVHALSGFLTDDLIEAFKEVEAISKNTKCAQPFFSVSLNPPDMENAPVELFEQTIRRIEERNKLTGQPCAVVFHEKEGRRDLSPKFPPALCGVLGVKSLALRRHLVHYLSLHEFHRCQVAQC